jgi:aryl-alcohol dehydrogenase-like predicted oxidoreductase
MDKRRLGDTDLDLTEIGFGAWAIGGTGWQWGWGPQDDEESIAAIRRALELGINWIDTAAIYGLGHSEEIVAKAVGTHRKEVIIATKCSLVWDANRKISDSLRAESVMRECDASLKRLKTDVIDLYQIHWPTDNEHIEEGWTAIGKLIEQGKVRWGGVSNFHYDLNNMHRAQSVREISSLQAAYSMLRRYPEKETFDYLRDNNIGFLAYSPMQAGLLTGKLDPSKIAADDWRRGSNEFKEPNLRINLEFVEKLVPIAKKYNKTVAQLSIAWVLRASEVTSAIVGARRPAQIEETVGGAGWTIQNKDLKAIDALLAQRAEQIRSANGYIDPKE